MQKGGDTIALSAIAVLDIGLEILAIQAFGAALHAIVSQPFEGIVSNIGTGRGHRGHQGFDNVDCRYCRESGNPERADLRNSAELQRS